MGEADHTKLDDLSARIRQAEKTEATPEADKMQMPAQSSRAGYDFVGSVIGGAVLGWALDTSFPSIAPWGMIGMIVMGFAVGIMMVWRGMAASE